MDRCIKRAVWETLQSVPHKYNSYTVFMVISICMGTWNQSTFLLEFHFYYQMFTWTLHSKTWNHPLRNVCFQWIEKFIICLLIIIKMRREIFEFGITMVDSLRGTVLLFRYPRCSSSFSASTHNFCEPRSRTHHHVEVSLILQQHQVHII